MCQTDATAKTKNHNHQYSEYGAATRLDLKGKKLYLLEVPNGHTDPAMSSRFPVTEFVEVMERAGRNGTRAHLPPAVVRHILAHPAWREFLAERQKEMVSQWEEEHAPNSAPTGSFAAPDGAIEISPALAAAVERIEEAQWRTVVNQIKEKSRSRRGRAS